MSVLDRLQFYLMHFMPYPDVVPGRPQGQWVDIPNTHFDAEKGRQLDHALAAMVGGRSTLNYSVTLHAAQGDRHGRLLDADQPRQLGLRCLVQVHQPRNDRIRAGQNSVLRRALSKAPNNAASKSIHSKAEDSLAPLRQRGIVCRRERLLV